MEWDGSYNVKIKSVCDWWKIVQIGRVVFQCEMSSCEMIKMEMSNEKQSYCNHICQIDARMLILVNVHYTNGAIDFCSGYF